MTVDMTYTACSKSENEVIAKTCENPKRLKFKTLGLMLICFLNFGIYFCYDNPGALQDKFATELNMPASKFVILYSIYSWPNVILCFFGGFLLDGVFGIKWGTILYIALALCGQLLFAMGAFVDTFWLMVLGRFVFGVGAESVNIAQNNYTFVWFRGKALNTLFGIQVSFSLLGSILSTLSMGTMYTFVSETINSTGHRCIGIVLFLSSITCIVSIVCASLLGYMHDDSVKASKPDKVKIPASVQFKDVKNFNTTFWLLVFLCSTYYISLSPFAALAKLFFMKKYGFESNAANTLMSIMAIVPAITSPIFGIFIDKIGKNIVWILLSILGTLLAHGLLAFTYVSPYICIAILGFSASIFTTSVWPMIAHVMPEHQLGTAYGINQAFLNLSIGITSMISGIIVDNYGYFYLELFLLVWILISMIPAIMIWLLDPKTRNKTYDGEGSDASQERFLDGLHQPTVQCAKELIT